MACTRVLTFAARCVSGRVRDGDALVPLQHHDQLAVFPDGVAGAQTVAVQYWRGIGLGEWDWIGVGAGWPAGQLESKIDEQLKAARRVFLDADPRWCLPCEWHLVEVRELAQVEPHFHFKQVAPTIYEIKPLEEQSANDQPHLEKLLPESRPEEVKKCFNSG